MPNECPGEFKLQANSPCKKKSLRIYHSTIFILILYHLLIFCRSQIIWSGFYFFMQFFIVDLILLLKFYSLVIEHFIKIGGEYVTWHIQMKPHCATLYMYFTIWIQGVSSSLKGQLPCVQTLSLPTYFYDERKYV